MPERKGQYTVTLSSRPTILGYAAVAGKAVYTIVLHGFSGGEEALPGEFTLQTGGARYTHCVLKAASENKLVIEAGACEKITQRTQSGTEA